MDDRYRRYVHGTEIFLFERGVGVDAVDLIRERGLVAFDDYKDIDGLYGPDKIKQYIDENIFFVNGLNYCCAYVIVRK